MTTALDKETAKIDREIKVLECQIKALDGASRILIFALVFSFLWLIFAGVKFPYLFLVEPDIVLSYYIGLQIGGIVVAEVYRLIKYRSCKKII